MTDWKETYQNEIREMWDSRRSRGGVARVCRTCRGSSTSTCRCAKRRFIDNLQQNDFETWYRQRNILELERLQTRLQQIDKEKQYLISRIEECRTKLGGGNNNQLDK